MKKKGGRRKGGRAERRKAAAPLEVDNITIATVGISEVPLIPTFSKKSHPHQTFTYI